MIWDLHCHFGSADGRTPEEKMAKLIEIGDRMGVERYCVYMGYPMLNDPTPQQLREQNDTVLRGLVHWHHRAFGFVYLNPNHLEFSLEEFDRCVVHGPMVGVKLWVAKRCDAPEVDRIVEVAGKHKAVIFQHTWLKSGSANLPGESTPMDLAALASRHPSIPIICGHTGGQWESGLRAVRGLKNVSVDLAGSDPAAGFTEMAVREVGAERIIYGSDAGGRSFSTQLGKVSGARIPEAAKAKIFRDNLRNMMLPILTAKGVKV